MLEQIGTHPDTAPEPAEYPLLCDPDRPGDLSVVVQGGLSDGNLVQTANAVQHWRALFPAAQLVLGLSGSTVLVPGPAEAGIEAGPSGAGAAPILAPPFDRDAQLRAALGAILRNCDAVVMAPPAVPLPPIKADATMPNNINLQIAAAQAGLARATGRHVLRVRSDLLLLDRDFIRQHAAHVARPRGDAATLRQRVLVSWLYTLNPFAEERLPLHISDWFHFGLHADVQRLWDVPAMTVSDAQYYLAHPFAPGSNAAERLFHMRLAVEQHLALHALGGGDPALALGYHNDPAPAVRGLALLADNFILCDLRAARCVFPKYQEELYNHRKQTACITPEDWDRMVSYRHVDPRILLSAKIGQVREPARHEYRDGFPRRFVASELATEIGTVSRGMLIAHGNGLAARGPRMRLPPGDYVARLHAGPFEGEGVLHVTVVTANKTHVAGKALFDATVPPADRVLPFAVTGYGVEDVEILCEVERLDAVTLYALEVDRAAPRAADRPFPWFVPLARRSPAIRTGDAACTDAIAIRPGRYVAAFDLPPPLAAKPVTLRATVGDGREIATCRIDGRDGARAACELQFDVTDADVADLVLWAEQNTLPAAGFGVVIAQRGWNARTPAFPCLYDASMLRIGNGVAQFDRILSDGQDGVLCFGPYAALLPGGYVAQLHRGGTAPGSATLAVTGRGGQVQLASARFEGAALRAPTLSVPFDIGADGMTGVELVCSVRQPGTMFVTGISFDRRR